MNKKIINAVIKELEEYCQNPVWSIEYTFFGKEIKTLHISSMLCNLRTRLEKVKP